MSGVDYVGDELGQAWDLITLGGITFSGVAAVTGAAERKVEVKRQNGYDGAILKDAGYLPARLTITLTLGTAEAFEDLKRLLGVVHPRKRGGIRNPVSIEHPAPNMIGIQTIYVTSVGMPTISGPGGLTALAMQAIEWSPAPKKAKPKTNVKAGPALVPDDGVSICAVEPNQEHSLSGTSEASAAIYGPDGEVVGGMSVDLNQVSENFMQDNF